MGPHHEGSLLPRSYISLLNEEEQQQKEEKEEEVGIFISGTNEIITEH